MARPLIEPTAPRLFRDLFPYETPPLSPMRQGTLPLTLDPDLHLTDTTFRDGQQARPPYTVGQIRQLFDFLHRLAGPTGLIRQSEFFLYAERDREAVSLCQDRGYPFPEVTAWIRAAKADVPLVKAAQVAETGVLTPASDYHIFAKLGLTRAQALDRYLGIVKDILALGIRPRCHLEDVTRADVDGFVVPYLERLHELSLESGVEIRVRLCDTMGFGLPWSEADLPRGVPQLIHTIVAETGTPGRLLEWHGHNDFHLGVANAMAAWLHGVGAVNGTLLGFGERTGNTPLEGLIFLWMGITGRQDVDTLAITGAARFFERELSVVIPPTMPFVGRSMALTAAGIHADGLMKDPEVYSIFDTERLLGTPPGVLVSDKGGVAVVAFWVNRRRQQLGLAPLEKERPELAEIAAWVKRLFDEGRQTAISDPEMEAACAALAPSALS